MKNSILKMYAVTPCHAGSGSALGAVDNPIQRERHTNWPVIQASGMKGAMRIHFDRNKDKLGGDNSDTITDFIFGSEQQENAGSFSVSDAKILAFPMRSNIAPFVWITCPAILKRLSKDMKFAGMPELKLENLKVDEGKAVWVNKKFSDETQILLEDMEVNCGEEREIDGLGRLIGDADRLLIVGDDVFKYGVSHCTQVMAQIKIDHSTGTTPVGSLRYQEELPADTIMYSVIRWGDGRNKESDLKAEQIAGFFKDKVMSTHLQVGGDETLGRGIFELDWIEGGE